MRTETLGLFPAEGHGICRGAYSLTHCPNEGGTHRDPWGDRSYPAALANTLLGPTLTVGTACKGTEAALSSPPLGILRLQVTSPLFRPSPTPTSSR